MKSIPRSTEHPIIMLNPGEEPVKTEDGKYVFVGKIFGIPSINEDPEKVKALLKLFPRLSADELRSAKDAVYTWLLYSVGNSDEIRFVATEVVSPYEIGTRHQSMAYNERVDASKLYGGGELVKKGDGITFNLLSGTYSKPLIGYNKTVENEIIKEFKRFFPEAEYDESGDSYIFKVNTVSNELLDIYKKYGYVVKQFDTHNEWAYFNNTFWNIDFKIEHYKKLGNNELYINALKGMIDLLSVKKGGKRKTRRNCRKGHKDL